MTRLRTNQRTPAIKPSFNDFFSIFLKYRTEMIITVSTRIIGMIDSNKGRFAFLSGKITNDTRNGISQMRNPNPTSFTYLFIRFSLQPHINYLLIMIRILLHSLGRLFRVFRIFHKGKHEERTYCKTQGKEKRGLRRELVPKKSCYKSSR